jgi:flagellar hook-length control protein FliK
MTTTSPLQLNTANGVSQRSTMTGNANGGSDGSQFSAMLSGELGRSALASMPAPAPAPAPAAKQEAKPAEAEKPAQPDDAAPQQAAKPADSKTDAAGSKDDAAKADDDKSDDDSTARAGDPASAMLALMASLHKGAADTGKTTTAAQAFDALSGKGKRTDAGQLAALQAAMKSVAKEAGLDAAGAKTFSATSIKNPALAAAGADLGADKAAAATADLRGAAGNIQLDAKPQLDAADFTLQQARDAALLAQKEQAPTGAVATAQLQPAVLEAAQAAAASEELSAHVGTDAWNDQVGQKVVYMVGAEDQTASLTLNPPDLGPLQVVLSVSNGQADVTFSSNQLEVRQALENALPRLQEMMSESGIALGNATVNAGMSNGGQAQQDQAMASNGFGRRGNNGRGNDANTVVGEATVRPATRTAAIGDRGMVDTFA